MCDNPAHPPCMVQLVCDNYSKLCFYTNCRNDHDEPRPTLPRNMRKHDLFMSV